MATIKRQFTVKDIYAEEKNNAMAKEVGASKCFRR